MKTLLKLLFTAALLAGSADAQQQQIQVNALPSGSTPSSADYTICDQSGTTNKCTMAQVSTFMNANLPAGLQTLIGVGSLPAGSAMGSGDGVICEQSSYTYLCTMAQVSTFVNAHLPSPLVSASTAGTLGYTIATLPTCNSGAQGQFAYVTNGAASPTYLGTVGTTGTTVAPVFCNGSAWIYH